MTTYNVNLFIYGSVSKPWYLVNIKIAGKWMFIPLKMVSIGIDPYPYCYVRTHTHTLVTPHLACQARLRWRRWDFIASLGGL